MRKALAAIYLIAASAALASDLGGDGLGGAVLQPRANSVGLGEPGLANRELSQVDPVLIEAGEPALDFRFAENKWMRDSVTNQQSLITFSRSAAQSPGTYVGSDGLIKTAAVNLALYSEQFDQYLALGGTRMLANQIASPDAKQTADFLQETGATGLHYLSKFGGTVQSSNTYTFSVFVKYNGTKYLKIYLDGSGAGGSVFGTGAALVSTVFDVQNGIVFFSSNTVSTGISDAGNGWFRISITANSTGSGDAQNQYSLLDDDGTTEAYSGDDTSGIYFWGAQLEEGTTATPYIKTTSQALAAPRFDHDPVTGESLGLLVEEARTNYFTNSDSLATQNVTTTATAYTLSFYGTGTIDLTGTHTATVVGAGDYPTRTTLTFTPTAGTLTATVTGTVQYAQLEQGAFPTSYIPTVTSQTRYADVAVIEGTDFSTWFNATEGTLYAKFRSPTEATRGIASFDDGTANERIEAQTDGTDPKWLVIDGGSGPTIDAGSVTAYTFFSLAGAYKHNDLAASVNGGAAVTDIGTIPTVDRLRIGANQGGDYLNGHIRRLTYWPTRQSDSTLQVITQ